VKVKFGEQESECVGVSPLVNNAIIERDNQFMVGCLITAGNQLEQATIANGIHGMATPVDRHLDFYSAGLEGPINDLIGSDRLATQYRERIRMAATLKSLNIPFAQQWCFHSIRMKRFVASLI
jgi:hypothetical protein